MVLRSEDRGFHWMVTGKDLPAPLEVLAAEMNVDPTDAPTRLWGLSDEESANVWVSDDDGDSWTRIGEGLPADTEVTALTAAAPSRVSAAATPEACPGGTPVERPSAGTLLLGTAAGGVFRRACGAWQDVGTEGLPSLPVDDVDTVPGSGIIFASLSAAGLWRTGVAAACDDGDPDLLCIRDGRFRAEVDWLGPRGGHGAGIDGGAVPGGVDTWGWTWFFRPDNAELALKVLDGRPVNDHWWVFYASMTNVGFDLRVTDTATGAFRIYRNPAGTLASRGDSAAFPTAGNLPLIPQASRAPIVGLTAAATAPGRELGGAVPAAAETCGGGAGALCLQDGRFRVEATWHTAFGGNGTSTGVPLADDSGYLWFFRAENPELFVKVLDGRPVNGHWWVFYGSLSNVGFEIEVTDTTTGQSHTYENPLGTFASAAHTAAF